MKTVDQILGKRKLIIILIVHNISRTAKVLNYQGRIRVETTGEFIYPAGILLTVAPCCNIIIAIEKPFRFISHELPHMLADMEFDYRGDNALGETILDVLRERGERALGHSHPDMGMEYGTLLPMHFINEGVNARVLPVAVHLKLKLCWSNTLRITVRGACQLVKRAL